MYLFKGTLSGLRQFLVNESPVKMIAKRLDKKDKVNFKF